MLKAFHVSDEELWCADSAEEAAADTERLAEALRNWCDPHKGYPSAEMNDWADAIDAAIKQREQDKRDAARYRWLRDKSGRAGSPYIRCDDPPLKPMDYWVTAGTSDSCIDRAMAKESGNG